MQANERAPQSSAFKQQRLPAWQPILTPKLVVLTFLIVGVIFLPLGGVILAAANGVKEFKVRYDNVEACQVSRQEGNYGKTCQVAVDITEDMDGPVYFYYELHNFYQNHRRYVKSRSDSQLRNADSSTDGCYPLEDFNNTKLYACGLIAGSYFNDLFAAALTPADNSGTVSLSASAEVPLTGVPSEDIDLVGNLTAGLQSIYNEDTWVRDGIAWSSDVKHKFIGRDLNSDETDQGPFQAETKTFLPRVDDEDFIVWMRTAGLPTFRKLHRVVKRDLKKGDKLTVTIKNSTSLPLYSCMYRYTIYLCLDFPVDEFEGEKWVVVSTMSWLGGKNSFLGSAYIFVGVLCLVSAAAFGLAHKYRPRQLGDLSILEDDM
ncbi:MAG: hypothetical protein MHM6MM_003671 [Cercozoa sp. M6MM]